MHDWWPEGTVADVIESSEAMSDANGDADTGLPRENIWFLLVDGNAATSCSTEEEGEKKEPSIEEENKEDEVANIEDEDEEDQKAIHDPYMTEYDKTEHNKPKKRKKKKRGLTKKRKRKEV